MKKYDLITIGGGSGGSGAANRAGEYGKKVAIIENWDIGGTCVNRGCVPKKVSWYAATIADAIEKYGPNYGFTAEDVHFNYQTFLEARDGYVGRSRTGYENNFNKNGIDLYRGHARFVSNHEIEINGECIYGEHIIIATGRRPRPLDVEGAELVEYSDDVFNWTELPQSVLFYGAGYIAVELAQVYNSLGVDTSLAFRYDRPLRSFDRMLTDNLMVAMESSGLGLHPYTHIDSFRRNQDGQIECLMNGQVCITVDKVVAGIGRVPNTEDLGLENTDVKLDEAGLVVVNDKHETDAAGVYAIGDVIDRPNLTPVAIRAGRQISEYLFNDAPTSAIEYDNIPTVIFSHPPIGTIGLTEEQAIEEYGEGNIKVYTNRFFSMYASAGGYREACDFKLVCLGEEEKIIGLHGIGQGVDEMIQGFGVAMKMGATKKDFDSVVAIHPTGAEEFVTMR